MERFKDLRRRFNRPGARVEKLGPQLLLVRFDGRFVLCKREFYSHIGVHMAVGQMMYNLSHRPAPFPVRRVELFVGQSLYCSSQPRGSLGDLLNQLTPLRVVDGCENLKFPDWITGVRQNIIPFRFDYKKADYNFINSYSLLDLIPCDTNGISSYVRP